MNDIRRVDYCSKFNV